MKFNKNQVREIAREIVDHFALPTVETMYVNQMTGKIEYRPELVPVRDLAGIKLEKLPKPNYRFELVSRGVNEKDLEPMNDRELWENYPTKMGEIAHEHRQFLIEALAYSMDIELLNSERYEF